MSNYAKYIHLCYARQVVHIHKFLCYQAASILWYLPNGGE